MGLASMSKDNEVLAAWLEARMQQSPWLTFLFGISIPNRYASLSNPCRHTAHVVVVFQQTTQNQETLFQDRGRWERFLQVSNRADGGYGHKEEQHASEPSWFIERNWSATQLRHLSQLQRSGATFGIQGHFTQMGGLLGCKRILGLKSASRRFLRSMPAFGQNVSAW